MNLIPPRFHAILLLLGVYVFPALGERPKALVVLPSAEPAASACAALLTQMSHFFTSDSVAEDKTILVGNLSNLRDLFAGAGVSERSANRHLAALAQVKERATFPLLREVIQTIETAKGERRVLVCLAGKQCSLHHDNFAFLYTPNEQGDFRIVPFDEFEKETARLALPGAPGLEIGDAVGFSRPKETDWADTVEWVSAYFHEFTHFRDMKFIRAWMKANLTIKARGEEPDIYFQSYVRWHEGTPYLSSEFLSLVLETRAHSISNEVARILLDGGDFERFQRQRKRTTYDFLRRTLGRGFVEGWGINPENVLEGGNSIAAALEQTIAREAAR